MTPDELLAVIADEESSGAVGPVPVMEYLFNETGQAAANDTYSANTATLGANTSLEIFDSETVFKSVVGGQGALISGTDVYIPNASPWSIKIKFFLDSYNTAAASPGYPGLAVLRTGATTPLHIGISELGSYAGIFVTGTTNGFATFRSNDLGLDGAWHEVVISFDGIDSLALSSFKMSVDGAAKTVISGGGWSNYGNVNEIGTIFANYGLDGKIDYIQAYDIDILA